MAWSRREALAAAVLAAALAVGPAAAAPGVAAPGDMSLGNPKARVTVVEYASLTCPHCAEFNATVFPAFKAKYIDTGRVHYTLKELPTPPQQVAVAGFLLARCNGAGPAKYFKVVDEVFRSQPRWTAGNIKPVLQEIGRANGVSDAQFDACLRDEAQIQAMDARVRRVLTEDGIQSTPSFFVNGKAVDVHTLADLDAAIAAAGKK
ncbi:DsbA family protein [Phenylobacterium sp.]|uniref:DsbA family protein n=1 Tax=Phenylobacterium sp. TaxID=1871053 RepID=UPI002C329BD1|nr:DsbA family protein [Phenylobacterium sp.]HVI32495.1 DsbA family protein [Phenylobacterium sp.]